MDKKPEILCVYRNGTVLWVDAAENPKLRGVKLMGLRPAIIYLNNPDEELVETAGWKVHPTYGKVVVSYHG